MYVCMDIYIYIYSTCTPCFFTRNSYTCAYCTHTHTHTCMDAYIHTIRTPRQQTIIGAVEPAEPYDGQLQYTQEHVFGVPDSSSGSSCLLSFP